MEFGYKGYRGVVTSSLSGPYDLMRDGFVDGGLDMARVQVVHRTKYYGKVVGIRDVITFVGVDSLEDAEKAFRDSVDVYLSFAESRGEEPESPSDGHARTEAVFALPPPEDR